QLADSLVAASQPVVDSDLILYVLCGLGQGYESFVTIMMTRSDPLSSEDLHSLLLNYELHQDYFRPTVESSYVALFTTVTNPAHSSAGHPSNGSAPCYNNTRSHSNNHGRGSGQGRNNQQGKRNNNRSICQICSAPGHVALDYYNRLKLANLPRNWQLTMLKLPLGIRTGATISLPMIFPI
ncbi:hypothetical protein CFOL_v3_24963, partial [Cephalotus follicularis]